MTTGRPVSARASARISSAGRPRPWNANGDVRGLNAPPRSIEAPRRLDRARDLERLLARLDRARPGDQAERRRRRRPVRPSTLNDGRLVVGQLRARRACRGARSGRRGRRPAMPSRPSSRTPSGSPIAPIAVVSSPGQHEHVHAGRLQARLDRGDLGLAWPRVSSRSSGQAELAHAELVGAQVVRQLVADGARDLVAQQVGIVPEVAQQRVAEDDDPVRVVVARDRVALVEPVGAVARGPCRRSRPRRGRAP